MIFRWTLDYWKMLRGLFWNHDFFVKIWFFEKKSARLLPIKVPFRSHDLYFLMKRPSMGRTDWYLLVQSPYMTRTEPIFLEKVYIFVSEARPICQKTPCIWVVTNFWKGSLHMGRKSVQFLKRVLIIWVVSQINFWKGSLHMVRKSSQFLKGVLY